MEYLLFCFFLLGLTQVLVTFTSATYVVNTNKSYLIKQGILDDGSIFVYSPYFLWNNDVNSKPAELTKTLELRSTNGLLAVTLKVKAAVMQNQLFNMTTRLFCHDDHCTSPAPTLYCNPGDTIRITLINELENSPGIPEMGPLAGQVLYPNRTNIFIQGVPLDPALNSPHRFTSGGGDTMVFEHVIPASAPPGVHWYHSRVHGSSYLHVMGGLAGAFVVGPEQPRAVVSPNGTTAIIYAVPREFLSLTRTLVTLTHVMVQRVSQQIPGVVDDNFSLIDEPGAEGFANSSLSFPYLSAIYGSTLPTQVQLNASAVPATTRPDVWLTNGQYQPYYALQPNEWRLIDVVVASGDRMVELEVRTAVGYGAGEHACEVGTFRSVFLVHAHLHSEFVRLLHCT
jgi:FtsP/CotA-like multicopper oxidase with cupredoxin domain